MRFRFSARLLCTLIASVVFTSVFTGCGDSQDDLYARAARRPRYKAEDEPPTPTKPREVQPAQATDLVQPSLVLATPPPSESTAAAPRGSEATESAPANEATPAADPIQYQAITFAPLTERAAAFRGETRPAVLQMSVKLQAIGTAIKKHTFKHNRLPASAIESKDGTRTLSWRVAILPYMGYQSLYDQFDPEFSWDHPRNLPLLEYIPHEFVSPQRIDTKTNVLGVAGTNQAFFGRGGGMDEDAGDGFANTLAVIEVDDTFAVPWTQPADYPIEADDFRSGAGSLRQSGILGIFADGSPTFIPNTVPDPEFAKLLNFNGYDGVLARQYGSPVSVAMKGHKQLGTTSQMAASSAVPVRPKNLRPDPVPGTFSPQSRSPLPSRAEQIVATKTVDQLHGKRIEEATTESAQAKLAEELYLQAKSIDADPVGAYALYQSAIDLARQSHHAGITLKCVDAIIERYEVDEFEVAAAAILELNPTAIAGRRSKDGELLAKRILPLIHQAVRSDRFETAIQIVRAVIRAIPSTGKTENSNKYALGKLATKLIAAQRKYDEIEESFAKNARGEGDSKSSYEIGLFYCFHKGDWDNGLPLLTDCGNETVEALANLDISGGDSTDYVNIGDAWWALSEKAKAGVYRENAKSRAAYWYQRSVENTADSLSKIYLEKKIAEIQKSDSPNLFAMISEVAEGFGVDMARELDSPAARRLASRNNFDED